MRALSGATRQLSQRESPWHVGQVYAGRAKHDVPGTVVLRCLGSRQLDKERCPEAAGPVSEARAFAPYRASGVQLRVARPAKASPFGRGVTEGDGEGKDAAKQLLHSDSIALTKNLLIAAQKLFCPGLALSVSLRSPALPEGEPLACRSGLCWTSKARCLGNSSALLPRFTAA